MLRKSRILVLMVASGALLALPASGVADPKPGKGQGKSKGAEKSCAKTPKLGFSARGTLVSFTADDPATPANEGTVTFTVTKANGHAKKSGDVTVGDDYTVPATDAFKVKLVGYEGTDTPSPGDAVKVNGKIERTKKKCAPEGTSLADRYGETDIRKVTIKDRDPDV